MVHLGAVHYVQVKGPLLTPAGLADAAARGQRVVTDDPNRSKAYARGATALGVAIALGEIGPDAVNDDVIAKDMNLFSAVTSTSAGGELTDCEVIMFANSADATGEYRIGHGFLEDAVDVAGARSALRAAGLEFECEPDAYAQKQIAAVFAKAEAPPGGRLRGQRTTMLSDADINYERHARAAVGAVIASLTGDPRIFVSGGTEHQAPPGQAPIAAIVRAPVRPRDAGLHAGRRARDAGEGGTGQNSRARCCARATNGLTALRNWANDGGTSTWLKKSFAVAVGTIGVGDRLPNERELAERCDVSRATVREAILALELGGVVEVRPGSGTYLTGLGVPSANLVAPPFDSSPVSSCMLVR